MKTALLLHQKALKKLISNTLKAAGHHCHTKKAHGGQGLPESLGIVISEMVGSSNWAWGMYPGLSHGAMNTIELHGTPEQKVVFDQAGIRRMDWHHVLDRTPLRF